MGLIFIDQTVAPMRKEEVSFWSGQKWKTTTCVCQHREQIAKQNWDQSKLKSKWSIDLCYREIQPHTLVTSPNSHQDKSTLSVLISCLKLPSISLIEKRLGFHNLPEFIGTIEIKDLFKVLRSVFLISCWDWKSQCLMLLLSQKPPPSCKPEWRCSISAIPA